MKDRELNKRYTSRLSLISHKQSTRRTQPVSPEMLNFQQLFSQYKAKVYEQQAHLFQ